MRFLASVTLLSCSLSGLALGQFTTYYLDKMIVTDTTEAHNADPKVPVPSLEVLVGTSEANGGETSCKGEWNQNGTEWWRDLSCGGAGWRAQLYNNFTDGNIVQTLLFGQSTSSNYTSQVAAQELGVIAGAGSKWQPSAQLGGTRSYFALMYTRFVNDDVPVNSSLAFH